MRYNAACCAVLAGAGSGHDAPPPADRGVFRQQGLGWLRAEFDAYQKANDANPAAAAAIHETMKHWLGDSDLVSVRDATALAALPQAEQDAWNKLWADVRRLHAATVPKPSRGR
jgi:hypothetical protein